nr:MAG TPA: hypothetical protein [Caudoviricetes sp.]
MCFLPISITFALANQWKHLNNIIIIKTIKYD